MPLGKPSWPRTSISPGRAVLLAIRADDLNEVFARTSNETMNRHNTDTRTDLRGNMASPLLWGGGLAGDLFGEIPRQLFTKQDIDYLQHRIEKFDSLD